MADNTLYRRIGGRTQLAALANRFYDVMERDKSATTVLHLHPSDLTRSRKRLEHFLCEWFGGPKLFGEPYVNADWLKLRHKHLNIGLEERDQWMHCMATAMRELEFDPLLQEELTGMFFNMAGYMRTRV